MAKKKTFKIGVYGLKRGLNFVKHFNVIDGAEIVSVCEKDEATIEKAKPFLSDSVKFFSDFDEFIDSGMDAVVLTNFFHEHAKCAVIALEKKIHVLSDTTAAPTLAECVQLCRAVEKSKCKYMLAANTSFMPGPFELRKICESGKIGDVVYGEAEYLHNGATEAPTAGFVNRDKKSYKHWRTFIPRTYYNMHTLGALMEITGTVPVKVSGKAIYTPELCEKMGNPFRGDISSITVSEMDNGAVFTTTGHSHLGPTSKWFRLGGTLGNAETLRFDQTSVRVDYMPYAIPEGGEASEVYKPKIAGESEVFTKKELQKYVPPQKATGHYGGCDLWVSTYFIKYLRKEVTPFFDVYRATALSAAGILAWRSILEGGREIDVPDFRDKRRRRKYEKDTLSPFPDENGNVSVPAGSHGYNLFKKYGIEE